MSTMSTMPTQQNNKQCNHKFIHQKSPQATAWEIASIGLFAIITVKIVTNYITNYKSSALDSAVCLTLSGWLLL